MLQDVNFGEICIKQDEKKRLEKIVLSSNGKSIDDYELLTSFLLSTHRITQSRAIADRLISYFGNIGRVIGADYFELNGVTPELNDAAIAKIFCVRETFSRALKSEFKEERVLDNIKKVIKYLKVAIGQSRKEHFRVMYLDQGYYLIHEDIQDYGTVDSSPMYIREIISYLLIYFIQVAPIYRLQLSCLQNLARSPILFYH